VCRLRAAVCGSGPGGAGTWHPVGTSVQRLATSLRDTHAISDQRLSALLAQVFGLGIRQGGLAHLFQVVQGRLEHRVADILTRWRRRRLICRDETSARVNGRQPWEWVLQNTEVCIHVIRPRRGQGVIPEVLGAHRPTVWVSDLYSAQKNHPAEPWQVCLAHQLRDGPWALEAGDTVLAPRMKAVLLRAFAIHHRRDTLAASTLDQYRCDLRRRVHRCRALQPTNPHGRRRQTRDANIQHHLFLVLEDVAIPPTHHASEPAMRMRTVFRKVTKGCRSDWGPDVFAAVRSIVNTGQRQGLSAVQAIQKALSPVGAPLDPS
jgi:transposase